MNKKGFTLVELLAVIVILAVVMLIAVTAVGPLMARARKNSLGSEGLALIKAATSKYSEEGIKGADADFTPTTSVCYNIKYLCEKGYFEKGCGDDGYSGSVLVKYNNGSYEYYFWLSNGTYVFNAANEDNYGNIDDTSIVYDGTEASLDCGKSISDDTPNEIKTNITSSNESVLSSIDSMVVYNEETSGGTSTWNPSVVPTNVNLISFTIRYINDDVYNAEEGMTWSEWSSSKYNTSVFHWNGYRVQYDRSDGSKLFLYYNGTEIEEGTEVIVDGRKYDVGMELPRDYG